MKLGLLLAKDPSLKDDSRQQIEQCTSLLADCIKEVRTLSYLLYPPMLEERGLKSAIEWYLDGFMKRSAITVNFDTPGSLDRPSRDVELALFRVLQESLTNVHKHSGSTVIDVELSAQNGTMDLKVRDYGKGLPEKASARAESELAGIGMRGMSERMRQLGGSLTISSVTPGTLVHARVPGKAISKASALNPFPSTS